MRLKEEKKILLFFRLQSVTAKALSMCNIFLLSFQSVGFSLVCFRFFGFLLQILAVHEMVGIIEIDGADAGDIGGDAHVIVGNALGGPDGAGFARAGTVDLELPHFVGIGHREAFTPVGIAVFLCQFGDGVVVDLD